MIDLTHLTPDEAMAEYRRRTNGTAGRGGRASKYHAVRTSYNGQWYDSKAEADRAAHLDVLLRGGLIRGWCRPASIVLVDDPDPAKRITYKPDFYVVPASGAPRYEDQKGVMTRDALLKIKLWRKVRSEPLWVIDAHGNEVTA